jgi:hypothetical protein
MFKNSINIEAEIFVMQPGAYSLTGHENIA